MPRLLSGAATVRPETTNLMLPLIPEVSWQQPQETHLTNILKTSTTETLKNIHMPESERRKDVESQMLPRKETSSQVSGYSAELFRGNQTGSTPVRSLYNSKKPESEIQRHEMNITANENGGDNIFPPKITNSQTEVQLVRDDMLPMNSTCQYSVQLSWNEWKICCMFLWISKMAGQ